MMKQRVRFWLDQTAPENQFERAHRTDAGYDIRAAEDVTVLPPGVLVSTGLYLDIPEGYVGVIKSRSGLAVKNNVETGAGVIDAGYHGEVKVLLRPFIRSAEDAPATFKRGERIAQLVILKLADEPAEQLLFKESLGDSDRGDGGFGSTGTC